MLRILDQIVNLKKNMNNTPLLSYTKLFTRISSFLLVVAALFLSCGRSDAEKALIEDLRGKIQKKSNEILMDRFYAGAGSSSNYLRSETEKVDYLLKNIENLTTRELDYIDKIVNSSNFPNNYEIGNEKEKPQEKSSSGNFTSECDCTEQDARKIANKIRNEFTRIQNNRNSEDAKVMSIKSIEKSSDCDWIINIKVSWPFGNTDGLHPDEYYQKLLKCNNGRLME
jgi:hypothetical protein